MAAGRSEGRCRIRDVQLLRRSRWNSWPALVSPVETSSCRRPGCDHRALTVAADVRRGLRILSRTLNVNGREFSIVGVAPRGFDGLVRGQRAELWTPVSQSADAAGMAKRTYSWLNTVARLRPGSSPGAAAEQLTSVYRATSIDPMAGQEEARLLDASHGDLSLVEGLEAPIRLLMATVGLILVIASANVANLLLARSQRRQREIAIRQAIGATRRRIAQLLLAESLVVALAGGALGLFSLLVRRRLRGAHAAAQLPLTLPLEPRDRAVYRRPLDLRRACRRSDPGSGGLADRSRRRDPARRRRCSGRRRNDTGPAGARCRADRALPGHDDCFSTVSAQLVAPAFSRSVAQHGSILAATVDLNCAATTVPAASNSTPICWDVCVRHQASNLRHLRSCCPSPRAACVQSWGPTDKPALDTAIDDDVVPVATDSSTRWAFHCSAARSLANPQWLRVIIVNDVQTEVLAGSGRDRGAILDRQRGTYEIIGVARDTSTEIFVSRLA